MPNGRPWAFERGILWTRECDGIDLMAAPPHMEATLSEAQAETAASLAQAMGLADTAPILQRFNSGRRCFVAWVADAITSYGWVSQGAERVGELERAVHMLPGEAYIWDCATLPQYRGLRLYPALLTYIAATLRDEGIQRLWIGTSQQNLASIRGIVAAGFQPVIKLTYIRLFALDHIWASGYSTTSPRLVTQARAALTIPGSASEAVEKAKRGRR